MSYIQPGYQASMSLKALINVGMLMDVPTAYFVSGRYGESIMIGGVSALNAVVGHGNNFKSTIINKLASRILHRIGKSLGSTLDTEFNVHQDRLLSLHLQDPESDGSDPFSDGRWMVTDLSLHMGGEWFDKTKEYLKGKKNWDKEHRVNLPFLNRERNGYMNTPAFTFGIVDSLSEFKTEDVIKMADDASLGEKDGNTIFMRQGLQKNRFLMEIPSLCEASQHYMFLTAHIGDKLEMDPRNPSMQKLQHLKGNVKLKGVPEKFTFLMNNCWHAYGASVLSNDTTKAPEYPKDSIENQDKGSKDLNIVRLRMLRCKSGASGTELELIVSQSEGVLPTLTEYHYLKNRGRFGLVGSNVSHALVLYPEVKFGRTTVRSLIDSDSKLRRAFNITAELAQMHQYHGAGYQNELCTPEELYEDIKNLGYNWDQLLSTRGWWTTVGDHDEIPFLSIVDLLNMRLKKYVPYWLKKDEIPESVRDIKMERIF